MKDYLSNIVKYIKKLYSQSREEKIAYEQHQKMLMFEDIANRTQLQLQYELGTILTNVQLSSRLYGLKSYMDMTPCGYYTENNFCIYKFAITKSKPDEIIALVVLDIIKNKINSIISVEQKKLYSIYSNCTLPEQQELQYQFPMLCKGFRVINITSEYDDIIIHIVVK